MFRGAVVRTVTVLVVDDQEAILEICRRRLVSLGYTVLTARDGREALEVFEPAVGFGDHLGEALQHRDILGAEGVLQGAAHRHGAAQ
ncbi:response regulator, partial [bacterium]